MHLPLHIKQFFEARKISETTLKEFSIGWDGSRIVYPVFDSVGNQLFCNYRRDPKSEIGSKYMYDKGSKVALYGIQKMKDCQNILIVEGQNDLLASWSAGVPAVTSTGGALSFQQEWVNLFEGKDVTICLDSDEAGGKGMVKILKMLPEAYVLFLPDRNSIKDIGDFTTSGGDLKELLKSRIHFNNLQEVIDNKSSRQSTWEHTFFHEEYEKSYKVEEPRKKKVRIETDELARAKAYPITDLLKFNRYNKALCPYKTEKTGSFYYNVLDNTAHCFGCGKHVDSIDVYRVINNCSFAEAVEKMQ